jgi:hypothetical protein
LIKKDELEKYMKKIFLKKKIKKYLYNEWLTEKKLKRYTKAN